MIYRVLGFWSTSGLHLPNDEDYFFGDQVGLRASDSLVVRVTGCPNGCARPYMAELGLVGDGPNSYQVLHLPSLPNLSQNSLRMY